MRRPLAIVLLIMAFFFLSRPFPSVIGNTPPEMVRIDGVPADGRLENPLNATITFKDADGDNVTIVWYLDGERVGEGANLRRYIYPGPRNLTVILEDGKGGRTSMSWTLDPIPPPGWREGADNSKNRLIFWTIFGSAGLLFSVFLVWFLFKELQSRKGAGAEPSRKGQGRA